MASYHLFSSAIHPAAVGRDVIGMGDWMGLWALQGVAATITWAREEACCERRKFGLIQRYNIYWQHEDQSDGQCVQEKGCDQL